MIGSRAHAPADLVALQQERSPLRVTIRCAFCEEWSVREVTDPASPPRYCNRICRRRASQTRRAPYRKFCEVHQQANPLVHRCYGVIMCVTARSVWHMSCRRKQRHTDETVATAVAARTGDGCGVYPCPICLGWHVTSGGDMPQDWVDAVAAVAAAVHAAGVPVHPSLVDSAATAREES